MLCTHLTGLRVYGLRVKHILNLAAGHLFVGDQGISLAESQKKARAHKAVLEAGLPAEIRVEEHKKLFTRVGGRDQPRRNDLEKGGILVGGRKLHLGTNKTAAPIQISFRTPMYHPVLSKQENIPPPT